jgi:hypothetical protein
MPFFILGLRFREIEIGPSGASHEMDFSKGADMIASEG